MRVVYVVKLDEGEYIESYDLANKECSIIDDKLNAEHFHSRLSADWVADRLGGTVEGFELED